MKQGLMVEELCIDFSLLLVALHGLPKAARAAPESGLSSSTR